MKSGFTLLELLIVISIIGLLSSIVLVTYPTAVEKARIAKTLQWSASVNHLLGSEAVGVWTFDNIQGTTVYDDSGNNNNGANTGAVQVDGVIGKGFEFDSADVIFVNDNASLNNYDGLTLSAWAKPTISGGFDGIMDKYYYPNSCGVRQFLFAIWSTNRACFWMGYNNGSTAVSICTPTNSITINQWNHIVATWGRATNTMKIYLNGAQKATYTNNSLNWTTNTNCGLQLGRYYVNSSYVFNGILDDLRIYKQAYTQAQVEQLYAEGLSEHQNLAKK